MPRKKVNVPVLFPEGARATRATRTRKVLTSFRTETGDPWEDGEVWLARVSLTRQARAERKNGEKDWRRYYKWYEGEQWEDRGGLGAQVSSDNPRNTATVNKTGSISHRIGPFMINGEITFLLEPTKPTFDDGRGVRIQQSLLNYEWRIQRITEQVKKCRDDEIIIGHCVAKIGYTVEVDEARKVEANGVINYADYIRQDAPWVERVNPLNFIFDLSAKDYTLHTARWCAEVFFVPYADLLSNKTYDYETLGQLRSGDSSVSSKWNWEMLGVDPRAIKAMQAVTLPEDNLVALIEIWDKKYQKRMIYADGCPRPLFVEDWPYPHLKNFPYVMCNYIHAPNQPYGIGLPRWFEDQQIQLNRASTLEQDVMRKSRPQRTIDPDVDPAEVTKFQSGDDNIVARKDQIGLIQAADLSQMFQVYKQNLERVMEEMSGADRLLQGGQLPSRTTAGEVGTRARLTGLILDQHVVEFEEFVEDVATQVLAHLKKFRTTEDVIKVAGPEGESWEQYTNEDILDDVEVDVEYFAAPKTDPELDKQQALQVFEIAVRALPVLAQTGAPDTFNMPKLVGWLLDKLGVKDSSTFFRSSRTPMPAQEGAGMTPAIGGAFAPSPISPTPNVGAPGEGGSVQDLMQSMRGYMQ